MAKAFHDIMRALCDPVPTQRREALTELEHAPTEEIERFCLQARSLSFSESLELCSVLSGASITPLIDLLGVYATSNERSLRERALSALQTVPPALRGACISRLLVNPEPETRAAACRILAQGGNLSARNDLVQSLQDPEWQVVLEALNALEQLQCFDASEDVIALLEHPSEQVRIRAIEALVTLAIEDEFPLTPMLRLLRHDIRPEVRITACWAFDKRPDPAAIPHLLTLAQNAPLPTLQTAAISSLGAYPTPEVASALIRLGAMHPVPVIAIQCRRALNRMPDELLLQVSEEMLRDNDTDLRMEVASVVGDLSFHDAPHVLIYSLQHEEDDLTRATIVEALGRGGWSEAWNAVRLCVGEDILVAYPAVAALAELLDHAHLDDFVSILQERPEETLQEAVLKRLTIYGRSNALPLTIFDALRPFFLHTNWLLSSLSLRTAAFLSDPSVVLELLAIWTDLPDDSLRTEAATAIRHLTNDSVYQLLCFVGEGSLETLPAVMTHYDALGTEAEESFLRLLHLIHRGHPYARECLNFCVHCAPQITQKILLHVETPDAAILLEAWETLPQAAREKLKLNTVHLLHIGDTKMRQTLLRTIVPPADDALLAEIVSIALREGNDSVREEAQARVRLLVEYGKDETCEATSV